MQCWRAARPFDGKHGTWQSDSDDPPLKEDRPRHVAVETNLRYQFEAWVVLPMLEMHCIAVQPVLQPEWDVNGSQ